MQRSYLYDYDALNRITGATASSSDYNLGLVQYDKMGNITRLTRNGHRDVNATTFGLMDDLTYQYDGNQLKSINDAPSASAVTGFIEGAENTTEYQFDGNGNITRDDNKKVTSVEYNHLNMPTKITVTGSNAGTLDYVYDATGLKLRKINSNGTTTDYAGNYVYENGTLKQFDHPEGYVEPDGSGWQYVYRYTDIWGNTRVTYADDNGNGSVGSSEIRREQNYYPFGMEHRGYNFASYGVENNLKTYQKQEFTEDLGLKVHEWLYRMSDPATGRFWQIDPLAEEFMYNSTYAFQENKLGSGIELEGLENLEWEDQMFLEMSQEAQMMASGIAEQIDKFFASFSTTTKEKISTVGNDNLSAEATLEHKTTTTVRPNLQEFIDNIDVDFETGEAIMPNVELSTVTETTETTLNLSLKSETKLRGPIELNTKTTMSSNLVTGEDSSKSSLTVGVSGDGGQAGLNVTLKTDRLGQTVSVSATGAITIKKNTSRATVGFKHKLEE